MLNIIGQRKTIFLLLMLMGVIGACNSPYTTPVQVVNTFTPSPTVDATQIPALPTSAKVISPTMTAATSTAVFQFNSSCWPVKPLQEGNNIKGSFVYAKYSTHATKSNNFYAWDIGSFRDLVLDVEPKLTIGDGSYVSPDGKSIAVLSGRNLVLISSDGTRSFPLPGDEVVIRNYLSDGRILMVDLPNRDDTYREGVGLTDIFYILDPETGAITEHSVFLPNLEQELHHTFVIQYSPDMKYVLYKSLSKNRDTGSTFTLYDLEKSEIVWVGPSHAPNLGNAAWIVPAWRPDSGELTSIYINENGSNYYSISLNGNISSLTSFNGASLYTTQSDSWWSGYAEFPNWSPNGRYLLLSGSQKGDDYRVMGNSLYIWDDQEKVIYKPCLPGEEDRFLRPYFTNWSFDGSYFLVTLTIVSPMEASPPGKFPRSYILDLADKTIFEIPHDSNKGEFVSLYEKGFTAFLGWVDWEIP